MGSRQGRQQVLPLQGPSVQSLPMAGTQTTNLILCNLHTRNYGTKSD